MLINCRCKTSFYHLHATHKLLPQAKFSQLVNLHICITWSQFNASQHSLLIRCHLCSTSYIFLVTKFRSLDCFNYTKSTLQFILSASSQSLFFWRLSNLIFHTTDRHLISQHSPHPSAFHSGIKTLVPQIFPSTYCCFFPKIFWTFTTFPALTSYSYSFFVTFLTT